MTSTTLSAALTATATSMSVASATGFTVGYTVQIDGELMAVTSISGTTIGISRGIAGTRATNHGNARGLLVGTPAEFQQSPGVSNQQAPGGFLWNQAPHISHIPGVILEQVFPVTIATATAVTLKSGDVLNGLILQDPAGGAVTTTLPTAALLAAAIPGLQIGDSFIFHIRNTADAAETITVAAGSGGSMSGTATIAQNNAKSFRLRFTGVSSGNEAYVCYSLGTVVF